MTTSNIAISAFLVLAPMQTPPPQPQQPKASIEGTVVRIGTGEAVRARVTVARAVGGQTGQSIPLTPGTPLPNLPPGATLGPATSIAPNANPGVMTDEQGRFIIKDLDAGSYRLTIAANGYARQEYGQRITGGQGTPINLAAGQVLKDVVIRMTPAGTVTGRITDDFGQPAVGAQVQLVRGSYGPQGQRTFQSAGSTRTNDRGEYRLYWVTPGRYFLNAGSAQGTARPFELGGIDSPNGVQESYASMYYPGVIDIKEAATVEVVSGTESSAIDFSIPRQRLFRISGRVIDSRTGQRPDFVSIILGSRSLTGGGFTNSSTQNYNAATGTFEIRNVAPGTYTVSAQIADANQPQQPVPPFSGPPRPFGTASVTVSNSDVENVALTIMSGVTIPGRLVLEAEPLTKLATLDRMRVQLSFTDGVTPLGRPQPQAQPINADGTFRVDNVMPDQYRVNVAFLPPDVYVKEIRFDQEDVLNKPLLFSGSVSTPIDVVLSAKAGELQGTITNDKQALPGIQAVLVPDQHRDRIDLFKTAITDQTGRFTIRGIPPGDYKVFAWEAIEQFAYFDPELLRRFEAQGKPVRVLESDKQTIEVKVIPGTQQ
jgi:Carboxypeptidase regulatory-like domain